MCILILFCQLHGKSLLNKDVAPLQGAKAEHLHDVGRIGFEPMKSKQRIYSPPHLATLEPALVYR